MKRVTPLPNLKRRGPLAMLPHPQLVTPTTVRPHVPARFAAGGMVRGPGTGTSDSIPARLSNGEGILTAETVRRLGGPEAIKKLNAGAPVHFAGGGVAGQTGDDSVTVNPSPAPVLKAPTAPTTSSLPLTPLTGSAGPGVQAEEQYKAANPGAKAVNYLNAGMLDQLLASKGNAAGAQTTAQSAAKQAATSYANKPTFGTLPTVGDALAGTPGAPAPYSLSAAPAAYQAETLPGPYVDQTTMPSPLSTDPSQIASQYTAYGKLAGGGGPVSATDAEAGTAAGGGAAFSSYAQGAENSYLSQLKTAMGQLTDNAAAKGRLKTGFLTQDQGWLGRNVSSDFNNDMLTHALDAASLDEQASIVNANNQTTTSNQNAGRALQAAQGNQQVGANSAQFLTNFGAAAQGQDYSQAADERNFGATRADTDFAQALSGDQYRQGVQGQAFSQNQATNTQGLAAQGQEYSQYADQATRALAAENQDYTQKMGENTFAENNYTSDRDFTASTSQAAQNEADAQENFYTNLLGSMYGNEEQNQQTADANSGLGGFIKNIVSPLASAAGSVIGLGGSKPSGQVVKQSGSGVGGSPVYAAKGGVVKKKAPHRFAVVGR